MTVKATSHQAMSWRFRGAVTALAGVVLLFAGTTAAADPDSPTWPPGAPGSAEDPGPAGTSGAFRVGLADLLGPAPADADPSLASTGWAQSQGPSRQQQLIDQRREAAEDVEPASYTRFLEWLADIENIGTSEVFSWQIFRNLRIGWGQLTPNSGLTPSLRAEIARISNTQLKAYVGAAASFRGDQAYEAQFGFLDQPAPRPLQENGYLGAPFDWDNRSQKVLYKYLYSGASYISAPREEYYGLGDDSLEENRSTYLLEVGGVGVYGGWQVERWLGLQARVSYLTTNVGPGKDDSLPTTEEIFDETTAPGVTDQSDYVVFSGGIYGGRAGDPAQPILLGGATFERFDEVDSDRFDFSTLTLDGRAFLPLGARNRVVAVHLATLLSYPDAGSEVPFYFMRYLGGSQRLRGYNRFRFRDQNVLNMSAEYRWEAASGIEVAFFYDAGKVFAKRSEVGFDNLRNSYGFAVRGKSGLRTLLRIEIGHGDGGTFLWFGFGPSF